MIIGITGPICSGKSVLSEELVKRGFTRLTLSEEVRDEARKRGIPIERVALQTLGNELRKLYGKGYWAQRLLEKTKEGNQYVIEGIRNPGEIEKLRRIKDFVLIGITAPEEKRLQWMLARNKDSDPKTIEGIKVIDARDRGHGEDEHGQQSDACFALSDLLINNSGALEDLRKALERVLEELVYQPSDASAH